MSKRSTEHILKQVEWLNKLKNERKCELVELEYTKKGYRYDVFGQTKDGKTIICEIGNIHEGKYKTLLAKHKRGAIEFIYIPLNEEEADIALERNGFKKPKTFEPRPERCFTIPQFRSEIRGYTKKIFILNKEVRT